MTLIQCNNDGGDMQRLSNTEHNPTEDRGEVHIRGERAGYALKLFALPVLDLDITTYLGAFNGCRQDTRNSADEAQECFIGIRIKTSATQLKRSKNAIPYYEGGDQRCIQVRIAAQCITTLGRGTIKAVWVALYFYPGHFTQDQDTGCVCFSRLHGSHCIRGFLPLQDAFNHRVFERVLMIVRNPAICSTLTHYYTDGLSVMTQEYDAEDIKWDR